MASETVQLAGSIQIWILTHLNVRLGLLPLHIFKRPPLPPVPGLDPLLGPLEEGDQPLGVSAELPLEPPGNPLGPGGTVAFHQNVIIEGEKLPPGAGITLPATAAHQLPVNPG